MSVCAVFPCQHARNAAVVVISLPRLLQWERAHHLDGTDKASQGTADAAGVHEGEPPLGYSRVIRCMNRTLVNPINEPTHTHYWIALRKAGWVGSPTANFPPLGGSPPSPHQPSDQPITGKIIFRGTSSPPFSGSSIDHWALVKGLNALHKRGARSAIWLATTFG